VIFDTDILIWAERKNPNAARLIEKADQCCISVQTYMEFIQGAHSQAKVQLIKQMVSDCSFEILPLTENIGHRASIYIEEYAALTGLRSGDAIIAATAMERNLVLATGNQKHFKSIPDIQIQPFKP
jgi:predicted nucleic acid-binding protein